METYLITGGAGFIGSNFIRQLFETGNEIRVVNVDKLTYAANMDNLISIRGKPGYIFIKEDICSKENIDRIFEQYRPDHVINFAAETHVDRSISDSEDFIRTNVLGIQVLLNISLKYGVRRFIQISTDEVYGSIESGGCFSETSPVKPRNPYAASKAAADMLALSFNTTYEFPVIITRCTNNYGPGQHPEKLIPHIIKNCLEGRRIPIYGDGRNVRDWIYVKDHCAAIYKILQKGEPGGIYNISANNEKENIEVAKLIINALRVIFKDNESCLNTINTDLIEYVKDRQGHDRRYAISSEKLRRTLGWLPQHEFHSSLEQTVKWYVENKVFGD